MVFVLRPPDSLVRHQGLVSEPAVDQWINGSIADTCKLANFGLSYEGNKKFRDL